MRRRLTALRRALARDIRVAVPDEAREDNTGLLIAEPALSSD